MVGTERTIKCITKKCVSDRGFNILQTISEGKNEISNFIRFLYTLLIFKSLFLKKNAPADVTSGARDLNFGRIFSYILSVKPVLKGYSKQAKQKSEGQMVA